MGLVINNFYKVTCLLKNQIDPATKRNLQSYWSGNHVFFEYAEGLLVRIFLCTEKVRVHRRYIRTESAVLGTTARGYGLGGLARG